MIGLDRRRERCLAGFLSEMYNQVFKDTAQIRTSGVERLNSKFILNSDIDTSSYALIQYMLLN